MMEYDSQRLLEIIEPYSCWWDQKEEGMQVKAYDALNVFYSVLMNLSPEKKYRNGGGGIHTSYIFYLLQLRQALNQQNYVVACEALYHALTRTPFFQPRVMYNVVELIENYVNTGEKNV